MKTEAEEELNIKLEKTEGDPVSVENATRASHEIKTEAEEETRVRTGINSL